jgi:hypothetical protein
MAALLPKGDLRPVSDAHPACLPTERGGWNVEPLECWWSVAKSFECVVRIAASVRLGEPTRAEWWTHLLPTIVFSEDRSERSDAEALYLSYLLNEWMTMADIHLEYLWGGDGARLQVSSDGLFGALVSDLMLAVAGSDGFAFCSACGLAYIPEQMPRRGQRRFCQECRDLKKDKRAADRDYREKQRRLRKEGGGDID